MAEALVIQDTSYAGEAATYFITRPVIDMDTVKKGCIHVQDGIKEKYTIPRIDVTNFIQRRAATPVSKGSIVVDGRALVPRDLMLYTEFNPRDYEAHWQAVNLGSKLLDRQLPPTAEEFTMLQVMKRLNEFFEVATWRSRIVFDPLVGNVDPTSKGQVAGDAAYFYFDGLLTKLLNDAATVQVSSPLILVAGAGDGSHENIGAALMRAYSVVPPAILFKYGPAGTKIHISYATQQIYEDFLTTQSFKNNDTTEKGINKYKGYDVVPLSGMPDNTIVICFSNPGIDSNLWLGVNSVDDKEGLKLAQLQSNSELFYIKGLFKMDTQIGFPDFVVLYTNITA